MRGGSTGRGILVGDVFRVGLLDLSRTNFGDVDFFIIGIITSTVGDVGDSFGFFESELLVGETLLPCSLTSSLLGPLGLVDTADIVCDVSLPILVLRESFEALLRLLLFNVEMILSIEGRDESFEVGFLFGGGMLVFVGWGLKFGLGLGFVCRLGL